MTRLSWSAIIEHVFDSIQTCAELMRRFVKELEPGMLAVDRAEQCMRQVVEIERLAAAARTLLAGRVADGGAWRATGYRSAAEHLAAVAGTSVGQAIGELRTAFQLSSLPEVDEAVRSGQLSAQQAREVADAATADPSTGAALVEVAKREPMRTLQQRCAAVKHAADQGEAAKRHHANRRFRHWRDGDGAFRAEIYGPASAGARLAAAIEVAQGVEFREARSQGRRESAEAYAFDALLTLVTGSRPDQAPPSARDETPAAPTEAPTDHSPAVVSASGAQRLDCPNTDAAAAAPPTTAQRAGGDSRTGPRARPRARVCLTLSLEALQRGHLEPGDTCTIPGVGPVDLDTARGLLGDAILDVVIRDGIDIRTVVHLGRTVTAHQRTALEVRDPECVVDTCTATRNLEIDHVTGWAITHTTTLDDLARLCPTHHHQKTHDGYQLTGRPGAWVWTPPGERPAPHPRRAAPSPVPTLSSG